MKRALLILLPLASLTAGCVPMPHQTGMFPGPHVRTYPYPYGGHPVRAERGTESAVGRWDNVMLLDPGTPLRVLMKDGRREVGEFASADAEVLAVTTAAGVVGLPADRVMRVDRLPPPAHQDYGRAIGRGAAVGAGVVAVAGLLVGHVPPPRVFAAGAIMGAAQTTDATAAVRVPVTIYIARVP